jgi:5-oxoprolinase (ATP-hydrolysing)
VSCKADRTQPIHGEVIIGELCCQVMKLLSVDPEHYPDAPREGIRRILEKVTGISFPADQPIDSSRIEWIRMGTTVATNALLERKGERIALVTTSGFRDVLQIGNQSRQHIFDLKIARQELLYERVVEIDERVSIIDTEERAGRDSSIDAHAAPSSTNDNSELVQGVTGEWIRVVRPLDEDAVRQQLTAIKEHGISSLAVALMHSYTFARHERKIGEIAKELGFEHISLSSDIMPTVKIVPRAFTCCADAYLTPCIQRYIRTFMGGFDANFADDVRVSFMQSDGGLASVHNFTGFRAILSGPAGGVVGYGRTSYSSEQKQPVVGFDMGGTSTDVSRYAGTLEHIFENTTAGVTICAPQLDINTVAAGGGSMLFFRSGMFVVGPESAGAHPGPACYRKGGPLTVTDANLFLGRLQPREFPNIFGPHQNEPLDPEASRRLFVELTDHINTYNREHASTTPDSDSDSKQVFKPMTPQEVAYGFLCVANEAMCRPIRALTQAKGYKLSSHLLSCFGGAGGQHACAIARALDMRSIFIHRYSGILSAYGMGLADVVHEVQEPCSMEYSEEVVQQIQPRLHKLQIASESKLEGDGFEADQIHCSRYLNLRYRGTDTPMMTTLSDRAIAAGKSYLEVFVEHYKREHGFTLDRAVLIDDIRVRAIGTTRTTSLHDDVDSKMATPSNTSSTADATTGSSSADPAAAYKTRAYFDDGFVDETPVYRLQDVDVPHDWSVSGPAILIDNTSTIIVEPHCRATITRYRDVRITAGQREAHDLSTALDPIQLSVFAHRFMSIAEQMGRTLQRTAISTNIKERLDFSCALFGPDGGLVANAPHLPVHLGAMQEAVKFQIEHIGNSWQDGDVVLSNHPQAGGSHLPDITVITPVFDQQHDQPVFFVASRGHHGDIGGISPGSMPPFSKYLYQEGAALKSFRLVRKGVFDEKGISQALLTPAKVDLDPDEPQCVGTRNLADNLSDLNAQVAANHKGILLVQELIAESSLAVVHAYMKHIQDNAEAAVREMLCDISKQRKLDTIDTLYAKDHMDDGTPICLALTIDRNTGGAIFDFTGTGAQVFGNTNAPPSVTYAAIIYSLRCLVKREIPLNQGCLNPVTTIIPQHSLLNPSEDAAVVGGNVLTSQRVTDVVLRAFGACAASQGCMNNFTFGNDKFGYYETIAGGAGAGPTWTGQSGVHTHMTNTRITDAEIFERRYPVLLREFSIRAGSGGNGKYHGGDGVVRDVEFLQDLSCGILSERRSFQPYGMAGGMPGQRGVNVIVSTDGVIRNIGSKATYKAKAGDRIIIQTPGGGGYGEADSDSSQSPDAPMETSSATVSVRLSKVQTHGSLGAFRMSQESA